MALPDLIGVEELFGPPERAGASISPHGHPDRVPCAVEEPAGRPDPGPGTGRRAAVHDGRGDPHRAALPVDRRHTLVALTAGRGRRRELARVPGHGRPAHPRVGGLLLGLTPMVLLVTAATSLLAALTTLVLDSRTGAVAPNHRKVAGGAVRQAVVDLVVSWRFLDRNRLALGATCMTAVLVAIVSSLQTALMPAYFVAADLLALTGLTLSALAPALWAVIFWLVLRWIRVRDDRLLLALGAVVGITAETRFQVLALGISLARLEPGSTDKGSKFKCHAGSVFTCRQQSRLSISIHRGPPRRRAWIWAWATREFSVRSPVSLSWRYSGLARAPELTTLGAPEALTSEPHPQPTPTGPHAATPPPRQPSKTREDRARPKITRSQSAPSDSEQHLTVTVGRLSICENVWAILGSNQ